MNDRLLTLLKEENISSSRLADEIGVQRSSISHILSGRNKPSFDFLEKILLRFPNLNAEWLLLGKGQIYKSSAQKDLFNDIPKPEVLDKDNANLPERSISEKDVQNSTEQKTKAVGIQQEIKDIANLNIHKIIVFYSNNTFKEYTPAE